MFHLFWISAVCRGIKIKKEVDVFMEGYMLSIGYPVGVNTKNKTYEIELNNKMVSLTVDEMKLWVLMKKFIKQKIDDEKIGLCQSIIEKGVGFIAVEPIELYKKIKKRKLVRQGFFCIYNNRICVLLGKEKLYLSAEQCVIWKYGDGSYNIEEIFEFMNGIKIVDFLKCMCTLCDGSAVVIV